MSHYEVRLDDLDDIQRDESCIVTTDLRAVFGGQLSVENPIECLRIFVAPDGVRDLAAAILSGDLSGQIKHAVEIFALHTTLAQNLKMGAIFTIVSFALPPSACMRAASSSARICPPSCAARRRRAGCRRPADPLVRQASVGDVEAGVTAHDMVRRSAGAALDRPSDPVVQIGIAIDADRVIPALGLRQIEERRNGKGGVSAKSPSLDRRAVPRSSIAPDSMPHQPVGHVVDQRD